MQSDDIAQIIASEFGANASYVEDLFRQFQHNPRSVDDEWGKYFTSLSGSGNGGTPVAAAAAPATAPAAATPAPAAKPAATPEALAAAEPANRLPIRGTAL